MKSRRRASSSPHSNCRKTGTRAWPRSTAAWLNACTPRWRAARSRSPTRLRRGADTSPSLLLRDMRVGDDLLPFDDLLGDQCPHFFGRAGVHVEADLVQAIDGLLVGETGPGGSVDRL